MKKSISVILFIILTLTFTLPTLAFSSIPVTGISLTSSAINVDPGQSVNLQVKFTPVNTTQKLLTYVIDNKKIATVDAKGKVTGVSAGTTKITVYSASNKKISAKCTVTVSNLDPNVNRIGYPIVKKKITLKILISGTGAYQSDYDVMPFYKDLEAKTNIHIKWQVASGDDFTQKKNLMYASGAYVDAIMNGTTLFDEENYGVEQKILVPLQKYIDSGWMPNFKSLYGLRPDIRKLEKASNGNEYAIPDLWELGFKTNAHLFINQKWLSKLGLRMPTTTDEFEKVLMAFKTKDPNGNRKADEIPFSGQLENANFGINILYSSFGIEDGEENNLHHLGIVNGKVVIPQMNPRFMNAMDWVNKMYSEGLIDPVIVSQDSTTFQAEVQKGLVGAFCAQRLSDNSFSYQGMVNDYALVPPLKGPNGINPTWPGWIQGAKTGEFAMTKADKYPEATMRWVDAQMDVPEQLEGRFGYGNLLTKNADGKYQTNYVKPDGTTVPINTVNKQIPNTSGFYFLPGDVIKKNWVLSAGQQEPAPYDAVYGPYITKTPQDLLAFLRFNPSDNDKVGRMSIDINNYITEQIAKWISKGGVHNDWNGFKANLKAMGVDDYLKTYQTAYDIQKKSK